ncbi:MAG: Gfo/Idh/MocA family oxidoreductase [Acidobacteria bacterium]|nr:Gfo/Idh/MocA family oxidoreductase [Acidobacteriota bacterium]
MTRRELIALAGTAPAFLRSGLAAPNDRINIGFIGVGGMGTSRLNGFLRHADVNPVAVCDLDSTRVDKAVERIKSVRNTTPQTFGDYRKLLASKDIDAVCIATPDHWHALPMIQAAQAGKDVFVEKPLSYSIGEGRAMVRAARANNRVTQMGNHIHNDLPNYRRVVELVQSGAVGKIQRVAVWKTSDMKGIGAHADTAPPKEIDYDFWLGPAPRRAYNPNRSHYNFRYFWDYSGGMFIDFWCHITDIVYWALDLKAPKFVSAIGRRELADDNAETPNFMEVQYEFPGLNVVWSLNPQGPPGFENWSIGAAFQGTDGTIVTNYGEHRVLRKGVQVTDFKRPDPTIPDSPGHLREFLDSIKSRKLTSCDVEYGHRLTKGGHLGNIALRTGRRIQWDDAAEQVVGDRDAQKRVTRRYRKPWKLA